ncbi:MAG: pyridoxal-phosphate dependent enzyme [Alphaproteobacteria bacterium]|nr:pyridoxal-phosphate dependent enzyme [Alphaproteobacteria bacterium]
MYLQCPICETKFPLETDKNCCPNSSSKGKHPLVKVDENEELHRIFPTALTKRWNANKLSFSVFREFTGSYQLALKFGKSAWWLEKVISLSNECKKLSGIGFVRTSHCQADDLAKQIDIPAGTLFVKNETEQMMGSHKARHLAGVIMHLETLREINKTERKPLAIFAKGNAVVSAAIIAKAAGYKLYAFVPENIDATAEAVLTNYGTTVVKVEQNETETEDSCFIRYQQALKEFDWIPFAYYGHEIWSAVEGAELLEYEFLFNQYLIDAPLDVQVVQVGGAGLANAIATASQLFKKLNIIRKLPRFYACQTTGCYPLAHSYFLVLRELGRRGIVTLHPELSVALESDFDATYILSNYLLQIKMTALVISELAPRISESINDAIKYIGHNRNEFFKSWLELNNNSSAQDAFDYKTYDGLGIVKAMLISGGFPIIVDDDSVLKAQEQIVQTTNPFVSLPGSVGLAGLKYMIDKKIVLKGERCGLIFTGKTKIKSELKTDTNFVVDLKNNDEIKKIKA